MLFKFISMRFLSVIYIPYIVFILLVTSCHDVRKNNQLETIDRLLATLKEQDSIQVIYERDSVNYMINSMSSIRDSIKMNYENDTLLPAKAQILENHRVGLLSLLKFRKNDSLFVRLLGEERSVLHALKLDIVQGNGDRTSYVAFLKNESKKVKTIQTLGIKNRNHYLIGSKFFYEYNDSLKHYNRYLQSVKLSL